MLLLCQCTNKTYFFPNESNIRIDYAGGKLSILFYTLSGRSGGPKWHNKYTGAVVIISGHAAPAVLLHIFRLSMLMQIFLSRSHPAPNMPLRLIHVQYLPRFPGKGWVDLKKSFGDIFMCGRDDFELFYFQQIHLRSVSFHPAPDLPEVSGKYPRFRPCPPQSSG